MWANDTGRPLNFWWNVQGEWAEPPNRRRGGESGVQRVTLDTGDTYYVKRQRNFTYRSLSRPLGAPTLLREWRNLQLLARLGVPTVQAVVFHMRRIKGEWHAMLVTRALDGYVSLEEGFRRDLWDACTRAAILAAVLDAIAPLHEARRKHGHLYDKEVFVKIDNGRVDVAFLDLELCRRHVSRRKAAESDLRRLIRSLRSDGLTEREFKGMLDRQASLGMTMSDDFVARCLA